MCIRDRRLRGAGRAAQAVWREALVHYWSAWLAQQQELYFVASTATIALLDTERHNIEAVLALARDACAPLFPPLLTSGRLLLRQRFDPGSRHSLITSALDVALDAARAASPADGAADVSDAASGAGAASGAADGGAGQPGGAPPRGLTIPTALVEVVTCLCIEAGYALGEQQQREAQAGEYAKAVLLAAGRAAGEAILLEAGVPQLAEGVAIRAAGDAPLAPSAGHAAAPPPRARASWRARRSTCSACAST